MNHAQPPTRKFNCPVLTFVTKENAEREKTAHSSMRQIAHPNEEGVDPLNGAPGARVYPLEGDLPLGLGTPHLIQNDQGSRHPPEGKNVPYHKSKVPGLLPIITMAREAREAREAKGMLGARARDGTTAAKERGVPSHLSPTSLKYPLIPLLDIPTLVYKCT